MAGLPPGSFAAGRLTTQWPTHRGSGLRIAQAAQLWTQGRARRIPAQCRVSPHLWPAESRGMHIYTERCALPLLACLVVPRALAASESTGGRHAAANCSRTAVVDHDDDVADVAGTRVKPSDPFLSARPPARCAVLPCTSRAAATAPCPEPSIVHDRRRPLSFCTSAASVAGPQCFEYSQAGHCRCARPFGQPHVCLSAARRRARAFAASAQGASFRLGRCPRPIEGSLRIGVRRPAPVCGVLERALRTIGHRLCVLAVHAVRHRLGRRQRGDQPAGDVGHAGARASAAQVCRAAAAAAVIAVAAVRRNRSLRPLAHEMKARLSAARHWQGHLRHRRRCCGAAGRGGWQCRRTCGARAAVRGAGSRSPFVGRRWADGMGESTVALYERSCCYKYCACDRSASYLGGSVRTTCGHRRRHRPSSKSSRLSRNFPHITLAGHTSWRYAPSAQTRSYVDAEEDVPCTTSRAARRERKCRAKSGAALGEDE
jgi:hypothetical protein